VPTSADDVFFDGASGVVTCTVSATATCKNLNFTGFTGTFAGSSQVQAYGNLVCGSGMTWSYTGTVVFVGPGTLQITSNGKTVGPIQISSTGSPTVELQDAFASSGSITISGGTFTTNNFNVTATALSSSNSNTRTINLGSSTVTLSGTGSVVQFGTTTGMTFNAGTSTIVLSSATSPNLNVAATGLTFYDVSFTGANATQQQVSGENTFRNLSVTGRTSAGIKPFIVDSNQTINGTLTLSAGTNATMRTFVRSDTIGTTRTLTCAAVASLTDIDFRDITIAGAAAPVSGTRLGDCKGNSGITFDAAKTVFYRNATSSNWNAAWSFTNGGAADNTAFPLAQDIAVFPSSPTPYPSSGNTTSFSVSYNIGTIDMSARTSNTMTLATVSQTPAIYGNWINGTGTTLTGTGDLTFAGRGSQTITSSGKTFTQGIRTNTPSGSVTIQDAFLCSSSVFAVSQGTFDANGFNVTLNSSGASVATSATTTRTVAIGSGTWTIAGTSPWSAATSTNLTVTGTGTISLTSASSKTFAGGGIQTYPTLNQGGTGTLTVTGSNKFAGLTNTAIGRIQFTGGTTNEFTSFTISGALGNLLQLGSTNTTQAILQKPTAWNMGLLSTDAGNNTGLNFLSNDGTMEYLSVSYINGTVVAPFISVFIIESATSADAQSSLATLNIGVSESITAADAQAAGFICLGALSESATVADAVEAFRAFIASVAESATSSELVSAALTLSATIAELTTGSEQLAAQAVLSSQVSELAAIADSAAGGLLFLSNISEATTAQEIATAVLILNLSVSEATTASEVLAAVAAFNAVVPEQVSGADVANALITVGGAINEALTALDSVVNANTTRPNIAESATAFEVQTNVYTANPTIAELAQGTDVTQVVASTFSAASAETAQAVESFSPAGSVYNSSFAGSSSMSDTSQAARILTLSVSESAGVTDVYSCKFTAASYIIEQSVVTFGPISVTTIRFDYEAVKDLYNRKRTVYVPRYSIFSERVLVVPAMNRTVYVPRESVSAERTGLVSVVDRAVYVSRRSTSDDRTTSVDE
jgi:hypothetical protein